ncbi:MAG: TonB-dependent receptor [Pseudobdellovibrionaceae bacterium]
MKMLSLLLILTLSAFSQVTLAKTVSGRVIERGTRIPLKEVTVFILPHRLKAETDEQGNFTFENVPEGEYEFVINLTGYLRYQAFDSTENKRTRLLFVEKEEYSGFETVILGARDQRDRSVKTLSQEEFLSVPGAGGDPVKAVQNLPGVNRVAGFSSQVVIQGSAPEDTRYDIDGHEIPNAFHFGGLTSVVMPEAIGQVDYLSAGYGPENGRAMGGIVSLKTRDPQVEERSGKKFFFADNLKAGGLYEAKIDEASSYLVSGRYSYVGVFLREAFKDREDFNLTVVPEFADLTTVYQKRISESENLRVLGLASWDSLGFLFKEPIRDDPEIRGSFRNTVNFYRVIPQYEKKIDEMRTARLSMGVGQNTFLVDIGDNFFRNRGWQLTTRGEWEQRISENYLTQTGFDNQYSRGKVEVRLPILRDEGGVNDPFSSSEIREVGVNYRVANLGLYSRHQITQGPWEWVPSVRLEKYRRPTDLLILPRAAMSYTADSTLKYKSALGLYTQPPQPQQIDSVFGNPKVKSPQAVHAMVGFEKDWREGKTTGWTWGGALFHREFSKLVINSSDYVERDGNIVPEVYNNNGRGRAYGVENLWKYQDDQWSAWLSYTLSRSVRWDPKNSEYPFEFDQTHNLNLVAAKELENKWKLSGRFRYVTGNPNTPIVGSSLDADNDVYIPERGALYSERLSDFIQLDLRADRKWILDDSIISFYIDIQNVLNSKNAEGIQYSYDYSSRQKVMGLPILPSVGIKGEF